MTVTELKSPVEGFISIYLLTNHKYVCIFICFLNLVFLLYKTKNKGNKFSHGRGNCSN